MTVRVSQASLSERVQQQRARPIRRELQAAISKRRKNSPRTWAEPTTSQDLPQAEPKPTLPCLRLHFFGDRSCSTIWDLRPATSTTSLISLLRNPLDLLSPPASSPELVTPLQLCPRTNSQRTDRSQHFTHTLTPKLFVPARLTGILPIHRFTLPTQRICRDAESFQRASHIPKQPVSASLPSSDLPSLCSARKRKATAFLPSSASAGSNAPKLIRPLDDRQSFSEAKRSLPARFRRSSLHPTLEGHCTGDL